MTSQLGQDQFVLNHCHHKTNGFFVEFGACDGEHLSNTLWLEKYYGWTGILAEPARVWHNMLHGNRPGSMIDTRCVWATSGDTIEFTETPDPVFSSANQFLSSDHHIRIDKTTYPVETVSLLDLLSGHGAPRRIDYLSMDTEGSEFAILEAFDFDRFIIDVITVEHNYTPNRPRIYELLRAKGYERVEDVDSAWDDWYVHRPKI